jgi:alpha-beta hydrolase superfamily lysophospholipase
VQHLDGIRDGVDGTALFWQAWLPDEAPRAVVIVVHGLGEHSGRYTNVVDALVPRGYALYAMDHRGHGRSDGRRGYVPRFRLVVDDQAAFRDEAFDRHAGSPRFVLGHSFGGLVALAGATRPGQDIDGLVLSGAASAAGARTSFLTVARFRVLGAVSPRKPTIALDPSLVSNDPDVVEAYRRDPLVNHDPLPARTVAEMRARARRMPDDARAITAPVLLLHGSDDALVPDDASRLLANRIASSDLTLLLYPGLAHELFNEPERDRVLADVASWLDARS